MGSLKVLPLWLWAVGPRKRGDTTESSKSKADQSVAPFMCYDASYIVSASLDCLIWLPLLSTTLHTTSVLTAFTIQWQHEGLSACCPLPSQCSLAPSTASSDSPDIRLVSLRLNLISTARSSSLLRRLHHTTPRPLHVLLPHCHPLRLCPFLTRRPRPVRLPPAHRHRPVQPLPSLYHRTYVRGQVPPSQLRCHYRSLHRPVRPTTPRRPQQHSHTAASDVQCEWSEGDGLFGGCVAVDVHVEGWLGCRTGRGVQLAATVTATTSTTDAVSGRAERAAAVGRSEASKATNGSASRGRPRLTRIPRPAARATHSHITPTLVPHTRRHSRVHHRRRARLQPRDSAVRASPTRPTPGSPRYFGRSGIQPQQSCRRINGDDAAERAGAAVRAAGGSRDRASRADRARAAQCGRQWWSRWQRCWWRGTRRGGQAQAASDE